MDDRHMKRDLKLKKWVLGGAIGVFAIFIMRAVFVLIILNFFGGIIKDLYFDDEFDRRWKAGVERIQNKIKSGGEFFESFGNKEEEIEAGKDGR